MNDERTIFIFNGRVEDVRRLSEKIADKLVLELFNCGDRLHWLDDAGKLTPVSTRLLADLLTRHHFTNIRLATRDDGSHFVESHPLTLGQQDLIDVMTALVQRVAKGPSKARLLSEQQKRHIQDRVKQGEPREAVAEAYGVDLTTVKAVMTAAAA
jgi:hypothetical protein